MENLECYENVLGCNKLVFQIKHGDKSLIITADSIQNKEGWLRDIKACIQNRPIQNQSTNQSKQSKQSKQNTSNTSYAPLVPPPSSNSQRISDSDSKELRLARITIPNQYGGGFLTIQLNSSDRTLHHLKKLILENIRIKLYHPKDAKLNLSIDNRTPLPDSYVYDGFSPLYLLVAAKHMANRKTNKKNNHKENFID